MINIYPGRAPSPSVLDLVTQALVGTRSAPRPQHPPHNHGALPPARGKPCSPVAHAALAQDPAATVANASTIIPVLLSVLQSHPAEEQLLVVVYSLLTIVASQGGCHSRALGTWRGGAPSPSTGAQTLLPAAPRPRASLCPWTRALPGSGTAVGFRFLPLLPLRPLRLTSQWPPASPGRGVACGRGSPPRALPELTPVQPLTSAIESWGPREPRTLTWSLPALTSPPQSTDPTAESGKGCQASSRWDDRSKSGPLGHVCSPPERKHLGREAPRLVRAQ